VVTKKNEGCYRIEESMSYELKTIENRRETFDKFNVTGYKREGNKISLSFIFRALAEVQFEL